MIDTIQVPLSGARQATIRRMRPSTIINTAESFHTLGSQNIGARSIGSIISKSTTSATRMVPIETNDATSAIQAPEMGDGNVDLWNQWAETTRLALQRLASDERPAASAAAQLRVGRLASIQATLGLPTLQFAQVLGVSRTNLYKWLDASRKVDLQGASRERLAVVERIAKQWRERSAAPLVSVVNEPLTGGQTTFAMMVADSIDEAAVVGVFDELMVKLQGKPMSRSQKLASAGFTRRPSARSLPADE